MEAFEKMMKENGEIMHSAYYVQFGNTWTIRKTIDQLKTKHGWDQSVISENAANASDSVNIERNIDGMFILVPEVSQMAERFMGIKMVKHRYDINCDITSIYQPYYPTSKIKH